VLTFHGDGPEDFDQLAYFWLPEERAEQLAHLIPVRAWEAAGWLELTPGNVIDYGFIKGAVPQAGEALQHQAAGVRQDVRRRGDAEPGARRDRRPGQDDRRGHRRRAGVFSQSALTFAEPTADYERCVLAHTLHHNGNALLSWQAGHVKVKSDANGNKRPVKPKVGDHRTIDGIVAAIMSTRQGRRGTRAGEGSRYGTIGRCVRAAAGLTGRHEPCRKEHPPADVFDELVHAIEAEIAARARVGQVRRRRSGRHPRRTEAAG
jgi:hypothetical protein